VYAAANRFRRSAIRIEADELTYNLHIVIRFELELELVEGELDLAELPEAWNSRVAKYLGIEVPDDAAGVLQDIHWATGSFGYFPTYTLGNLLAAQLYEQARGELGDLDELIRSGDLAVLDGWLRERLYRHGGRFKSPEMVERLVGSLDVQPLMGYLRAKLEGPTD
jgi:carboxypeptidase Taq